MPLAPNVSVMHDARCWGKQFDKQVNKWLPLYVAEVAGGMMEYTEEERLERGCC